MLSCCAACAGFALSEAWSSASSRYSCSGSVRLSAAGTAAAGQCSRYSCSGSIYLHSQLVGLYLMASAECRCCAPHGGCMLVVVVVVVGAFVRWWCQQRRKHLKIWRQRQLLRRSLCTATYRRRCHRSPPAGPGSRSSGWCGGGATASTKAAPLPRRSRARSAAAMLLSLALPQADSS